MPVAVLAVAMAVVGAALELASHDSLVGWWVPVAVLAPLLAAILLTTTLAGTDVLLERSTPRLTRGRRMTHASMAMMLCCLPLAVAGAAVLDDAATLAMLRNALGFSGMTFLSATVIRVQAAWMPVLGYGLVSMATAPRDTAKGAAWWAWMVQPGQPNVSWVVAAVLVVAGVTAYVRRGPAA
ncbi:hypothetical protein [Micromonospora thermarum]|uniref:Uncharacterized protein n=1 Tax=Micromonospora thermarum TaxID=2720024 RepID=A0ABX0Z735_9ACTN|nr:hypothetical protein [Micromonospora thermarum]NJP31941.1 hypothetical protein [Micromonospora thermarum]